MIISKEQELIMLSRTRERDPPRLQVQVVLDAVRGDRDAVEIALP